jgi:hypothetical protein
MINVCALYAHRESDAIHLAMNKAKPWQLAQYTVQEASFVLLATVRWWLWRAA